MSKQKSEIKKYFSLISELFSPIQAKQNSLYKKGVAQEGQADADGQVGVAVKQLQTFLVFCQRQFISVIIIV